MGRGNKDCSLFSYEKGEPKVQTKKGFEFFLWEVVKQSEGLPVALMSLSGYLGVCMCTLTITCQYAR